MFRVQDFGFRICGLEVVPANALNATLCLNPRVILGVI